MSEEKLNKIFDNIKLKIIAEEAISCSNNYSSTLNEEITLYNEIIRLRSNQEKLIKYLDYKIKECENILEMLEGTNSHRIPILTARIYAYQDMLERVKNNNYE